MQGRDLDGDEERRDRGNNAVPKIHIAAIDDQGNWMLLVEVGGEVGNQQGVKLWAKKVVGDEDVELSTAEKHRLQID